ncbi:MAG: hypothetical protein FJ006_02810 [Chloroflexi bacterium]|nr:hypothetical protein [Chloroflexota bacterium]
MQIKHGRLKHCLAGLLLLAMLVSVAVLPLAEAQSAAILRWAEVYTPGKRGEVIVSPSEVSRIAVGRGDIIYAIDSEYDNVYRSDNGGLTWTEITRGLQNAGAGLPASEIAVAPDRPQNVAVVTDDSKKSMYLPIAALAGAILMCLVSMLLRRFNASPYPRCMARAVAVTWGGMLPSALKTELALAMFMY